MKKISIIMLLTIIIIPFFCSKRKVTIENIDRGVIALAKDRDVVYVGWRSLSNDPDDIAEQFDHSVDLFLDAGFCGLEPSTILDMTEDEPQIIREGKGNLEIIF